MAKIAIDAGHGLYTPGKRCLKSLDKNETREWILNDRVADALEKYLKSAGHETLRVDDTDGSSDVSLADRVAKANSWGADYYISVHHNAGINGGAGGGTIVFVYPGTSGKTTQTQEAIYKHAIARAGLKGNRSDGTQSADYYVLRKTSMAAALIECGFMDSATDIKYILDPKWSEKLALGIAEGICEVWGGTVSANAISGSSVGKYRVDIDDLNIRKGPGTNYEKTGKYTGKGVFTIIEIKAGPGSTKGWGKLKSGAGWISLDFATKVS